MRLLHLTGLVFPLRRSCLVSAYPLVPPWLSSNIRLYSSGIRNNTEVAGEFRHSDATQSHNKSIGERKEATSPGLRLMDYINSEDLQINMAKQIHGWKKFSYNSEEVPEEIRQSFATKSPDESVGVDTLEVLTLFGMVLAQYRSGSVEKRFIKQLVQRMCMNIPELKSCPSSFGSIMKDVKMLSVKDLDPEWDDKSRIISLLSSKGYKKEDYLTWIKCVQAKKSIDAFNVMNNVPFDTWPPFLVLFTLRRRYSCRLSAHKSVQLFQYSFPKLDKYWQFAAYIRSLRVAHQWLIEYVPVLSRIFILHVDNMNRSEFHLNQMLWLISKFGTNWTLNQARSLLEAQSIVVDEMKRLELNVDTKGYLALAYVARGLYPEHSRDIVEIVKAHSYEHSREELIALSHGTQENERGTVGRFPYQQGVYAMEILLSEDYTEALRNLNKVPDKKRSATLWGLLISRTHNLGQLSPFLTDIFWQKIKHDEVAMNHFLATKLTEGFKSNTKIKEILDYASSVGEHGRFVNFGSLAKFLVVKNEQELINLRNVLSSMDYVPIAAYEKLLVAERMFQPEAMWVTYERLRADGYDPTVRIIQTLCMAAADVSLKWGVLYAAQRAVVEFKTWVRGSNINSLSDAVDPLKLYPSDKLFYHYIVMLANANYQDLLKDVLPWMARIRFQPKKLTLCALIVNAPDKEFLKKHASKIQGEWPTEEEVASYQLYNSMMDR